ncbi:ankyrin repeat domain-containing protein [Spiroplasma endosymbiont of Tiphia femorata]|uniref:ankyrin repeat domain-containing protein n=1 Tax=Spiroplasma endosymbiont of Tiphia femorata TaxID=3066326 RepID=UPI0030D1AB55
MTKNEKLMIAIEEGNFKKTMKLVKNGADVNYRNFKYSICKKLTGKVTSYPDKNTSGNTPLMKAAKKGYLNIVKFLVENDADVNQINLRGETALDRAIENGHLDVIKFLKSCSPQAREREKNKQLMNAVKENDLEKIKLLLLNNANVNYTNSDIFTYTYRIKENSFQKNIKIGSGNSALTKAAKKGYLNIIKFLVENDADVNHIINYNKESALTRAAQNNHLDVIKFLVENNADINHTNQNGKTALILIADNNNIEGVKFLIENGAKIECIDNFWESINKVNLEVKEYLQSWILNSSKNEINSPNYSNQPTTNIKKQSLLMI